MKFDPFCWNEVKTNEKVATGKGWLRLRLSAPAALYIEAEGYEALYGYCAAFDVETSEEVTFRIEALKGVRAFQYRPPLTVTAPVGETFTNIDRMPVESGAMEEVTRARRMLEMERRAFLRDIRAERDAAVAAVRPAPAPAVAQVIEEPAALTVEDKA